MIVNLYVIRAEPGLFVRLRIVNGLTCVRLPIPDTLGAVPVKLPISA